jgi:CDP-diacylglycerol--glycerol-3-phosphate 3-phosphatidyltransferase
MFFRLSAGFVLPILALAHAPGVLLALLLLVAFLSDVFDGIIARRLGVDSLDLRRFDTRSDLVFGIGAVVGSLIEVPSSGGDWLPWVWGYAGLFVFRNLVDWWRYRASPSYHMWSGKLWSVVLMSYLFSVYLGGPLAVLQPLAFALYLINAAEGIAASIILPTPGKDIPSLWHVFEQKRKRETS